MATFRRFEEIEAWQNGRELVKRVYQLASCGEFAKDWGLRDQIQRAAVSICSNIAEGFGRRGNKEFVNFLWIAKGSAAEVMSQLYHARDFGYLGSEDFNDLYQRAETVATEIYYLIKYLTNNLNQTKL